MATISDDTECCQTVSVVVVDASGVPRSVFYRSIGGYLSRLTPPGNLTLIGSALFFTFGWYGIQDCGLWRTEGAEALRVPIPELACAVNYLATDGVALFFTLDGNSGTGLWKVDASGEHPTLITVPTHGLPGYPTISDLAAVGDALYFAIQSGQEHALWTSDGTAADTVRVREFSFGPTMLTNLSGTLLFAAYDGQTVPAFWTSDGTRDGTVRVGPLPSAVTDLVPPLVMVGNDIFFVAQDAAHGAELWALPVHALTGACPGDCDANHTVTVDELILGVDIALGVTSVSACDVADFNGDGEVTIDELLVVVNRALEGCG